MNQNEIVDDEATLFELYEKLRGGWTMIVGGVLLGIVGAVIGILFIPPKYEAVALVQVGQIGQVGQVGQVAPLPVEIPAQAVERMKSPAFQLAVARKIGDDKWLSDLSSSAASASSRLSMQVAKTAPVIDLKVTDKSPERAKATAEAVIQELAEKHTEIARPMLEKMRSELAIAKEKLAGAERELEGLSKMAAGAGIKDERFTQLSLIASLRVQKESEIFGQRQSIMAYETALIAPATQPAMALEPVYAATKPVYPKRSLLLALGVIGGLLAGICAVLIADACRSAADRKQRARNSQQENGAVDDDAFDIRGIERTKRPANVK